MNKWIVYRHVSPSGKVYIGITTNLKDRWNSNGRNYCTYNSIFKKAISKYGWNNIQHEVLLENISKSEAIYAERYLIKWYKMHNMSYNITDGGEGVWGRKDSLETIEKRRKAIKGKSLSEEHKNKLSLAHSSEKNIAASLRTLEKARQTWQGQHHTEETKQHLSALAKNRISDEQIARFMQYRHVGRALIPIIQMDLNDNFIREFSSVTEANHFLGKTSSSISNCLNNRAATAFGYKWKYKGKEAEYAA